MIPVRCTIGKPCSGCATTTRFNCHRTTRIPCSSSACFSPTGIMPHPLLHAGPFAVRLPLNLSSKTIRASTKSSSPRNRADDTWRCRGCAFSAIARNANLSASFVMLVVLWRLWTLVSATMCLRCLTLAGSSYFQFISDSYHRFFDGQPALI